MAYTGDTRNNALLLNNSRAANNFIRLTVDSLRRLQLYDGQYRTIADNERAKVYDAIVAADGTGDYSLLSEAVAAGKRYIFVRAGNYTETSGITLLPGTKIHGENKTRTNITFSGLSTDAIAHLNGSYETTGTVTVTNGSTTVVGVGTSFTNLSAGNTIVINNMDYTISSVTNDTNLEMTKTYVGNTISGNRFFAGGLVDKIEISGLSIINSGSTEDGIHLEGVREYDLYDLYVEGFLYGIHLIKCILGVIDHIDVNGCTSSGIRFDDTLNIVCEKMNGSNNVGVGIELAGLDGFTSGVIITGSEIIANGGDGISVSGNTNVVNIHGSQIIANNGNGIRSTNGTREIVISSCNILRNDIGINFAGVGNSITGCTIDFNTQYGLRAGDEGSISSNTIRSNGSDGIQLQSDTNNTISSNTITNNTSYGINMFGGSSDFNTITGNSIDTNGSGGVNLAGAGSCTVTGNVLVGNTGIGIDVDSDDNIVSSNRVSGSTTGILIDTGATDNIISSNNTKSNGTGITDNGTTTTLANNK